MTAAKTNERAGSRATLRQFPMSASKARVVLDLIRGEDVQSAAEILAGTSREAARVVHKVLTSAIANAVNNDGLVAEELFVSACYADEGITMKRFSPRARGRAGKIFKRTCHVTVIVSRLDEEALERLREERSSQVAASRARRVATSRRRADQQKSANRREAAAEARAADEVESDGDETSSEDVALDEAAAPVEVVDAETGESEDVEPGEEPAPTPSDETVADDATEETH